MAIRIERHANFSKQATLLDGLDVSPLKWRVCGCGLNRFVHEGMNHISNVEVHLKTRSGNVNIYKCIPGQNFSRLSSITVSRPCSVAVSLSTSFTYFMVELCGSLSYTVESGFCGSRNMPSTCLLVYV